MGIALVTDGDASGAGGADSDAKNKEATIKAAQLAVGRQTEE